MFKSTLIFIVIVNAMFFATWEATAASTEDPVEDIAAKLHIKSIVEMYTDGQSKLLCVEIKTNQYALWKPLDNSLSPPSENKSCVVSEKFHRVSYKVNRLGYNVLMAGTPVRTASFAGADNISLIINNFGNKCPLNLESHFSIKNRDGSSVGFYLITRLKKPEQFVRKACNDEYPPIKQEVTLEYEAQSVLSSIDLDGSESLIFTYDSTTEPVLLKLKSLPNSIWASSDGSVFIVPDALLFPRLNGILDLQKRYDILLDVIGKFVKPAQ